MIASATMPTTQSVITIWHYHSRAVGGRATARSVAGHSSLSHGLPEQFGQSRDVHRDPPRLVPGQRDATPVGCRAQRMA
jgi:hypothetical protein